MRAQHDLLLGYSHNRLAVSRPLAAFVRTHGVRHLEMRIDSIDADGAMRSDAFVREVRQFCDGEGLSLSFHAYPGINLAEKVDRVRELCVDIHREQLDFCERTGAAWLVLHAGTCGFSQDVERKRERAELVGAALDQITEHAEGYKAMLCLETVERLPAGVKKSYLGDCLAEMTALLDGRERFVGAVFDTGHTNINPERSAREFAIGLAPWLKAVHVHANDGAKDRHSAIDRDWVQDRIDLFHWLAELSGQGVPLIAEHHSFEEAEASLEILNALKAPS